jgi:hypothetical protein
MRLFSVSDNSFHKPGFPWINSIKLGLWHQETCKLCGRALTRVTGDIHVTLLPKKGTKWPDVLGTGHVPMFIVSERVLEAWYKEKLGEYPHYRVEILRPFPKAIKDSLPPNYYWVDGSKMCGALLDFKASGFVGVKFCPECGTRSHNVSATYDRQHAKAWPYVFLPGTWKGGNLFTSDLSYAYFFCTEAVLECARKYKLTNFRFIPIEEGSGIGSKGIEYM